MRRTYSILLTLSLAAIILLGSGASSEAVEQKDKSTRGDGTPKRRHDRFEPSDENIDRVMSRLKQFNPEKAKELAKLRMGDPERFKTELKEAIRAGFSREAGLYKGSEANQDFGLGIRQSVWGGGPESKISELMNKKYDEHLKWLKENYPKQAEKLSELKKNQPNAYREQIALSLKKYGRIAEVSKSDRQLAEILKEGLILKEQRDKLLEKVKAASDEDEKKRLVTELEGVVSHNFALVAKKKQIKHKQLLKKLEKLQKEIKQSEAEVEKWKNTRFRNEKVKAHVKDLISGNKELK